MWRFVWSVQKGCVWCCKWVCCVAVWKILGMFRWGGERRWCALSAKRKRVCTFVRLRVSVFVAASACACRCVTVWVNVPLGVKEGGALSAKRVCRMCMLS